MPIITLLTANCSPGILNGYAPEYVQKVTHDDRVLVTIITDGYENASRTWSGKQIKSLVEELRQMGWTFTYIGADQDVVEVAEEIGVQNSLRFSANAEET